MYGLPERTLPTFIPVIQFRNVHSNDQLLIQASFMFLQDNLTRIQIKYRPMDTQLMLCLTNIIIYKAITRNNFIYDAQNELNEILRNSGLDMQIWLQDRGSH